MELKAEPPSPDEEANSEGAYLRGKAERRDSKKEDPGTDEDEEDEGEDEDTPEPQEEEGPQQELSTYAKLQDVDRPSLRIANDAFQLDEENESHSAWRPVLAPLSAALIAHFRSVGCIRADGGAIGTGCLLAQNGKDYGLLLTSASVARPYFDPQTLRRVGTEALVVSWNIGSDSSHATAESKACSLL